MIKNQYDERMNDRICKYRSEKALFASGIEERPATIVNRSQSLIASFVTTSGYSIVEISAIFTTIQYPACKTDASNDFICYVCTGDISRV